VWWKIIRIGAAPTIDGGAAPRDHALGFPLKYGIDMSTTLFIRLFRRGFKLAAQQPPSETSETGEAAPKGPMFEAIDRDCADAYDAMRRMYRALAIARDAFEKYAEHHRGKLGGMATLVDTMDTQLKVSANETLAALMKSAMGDDHTAETPSDWIDIGAISSTRKVGMIVKLLGRTRSGAIYMDPGQWLGDRWSIEEGDRLPPTHYMPLEKLPSGY